MTVCGGTGAAFGAEAGGPLPAWSGRRKQTWWRASGRGEGHSFGAGQPMDPELVHSPVVVPCLHLSHRGFLVSARGLHKYSCAQLHCRALAPLVCHRAVGSAQASLLS